MVYPGDLGVSLYYLQAIMMGLPVVDDNRQAQFLCQLQLGMEDRLLKFPGRIVLPVIVQANFPDGLHLGVGG